MFQSACRLVAAFAAAVVVAGCATPDATKPAEPRPSTAPTSGTSTAPTTATPTAPVAPEVPPAEARPMAARLALQAVDQLQGGDDIGARATLDQALRLDPNNELAKNLMNQINADAQRELGATFFRYTVQPGESLSRLAQQYMGDRFRFWILAKYNDIANPSRLSAGQVIKIPGRQPAVPPPVVATPEAAPAKAAEPESPRTDTQLADAMKRGAEQERSNNLEAAYATYVDVVARYPSNSEALKKRDATKTSLIRTLDREASQAFQRQNLDLAISKWDRILELDANNRKARLERERALDLKKRMTEKFGAPK
ncbi:MAG TPA: LysM domain-containing protein [Casimicrobiaceae bacterium]